MSAPIASSAPHASANATFDRIECSLKHTKIMCAVQLILLLIILVKLPETDAAAGIERGTVSNLVPAP